MSGWSGNREDRAETEATGHRQAAAAEGAGSREEQETVDSGKREKPAAQEETDEQKTERLRDRHRQRDSGTPQQDHGCGGCYGRPLYSGYGQEQDGSHGDHDLSGQSVFQKTGGGRVYPERIRKEPGADTDRGTGHSGDSHSSYKHTECGDCTRRFGGLYAESGRKRRYFHHFCQPGGGRV